MKLPSLSYLLQAGITGLKRQALTVGSAFLSALFFSLAIRANDLDYQGYIYLNLGLCSALGIPFFFLAFALSAQFKPERKWIYYVPSLLILPVVFYSLPSSHPESVFPYIRVFLVFLALHLVIAVAPFLRSGGQRAFWNYNRALLTRFMISSVFAGVIFVGILLALGALHALFDVVIPDLLIPRIWVFLAFLGSSWFFVSGFEWNLEHWEAEEIPQKSFKFLTQYILLPLLCLYLVILYSYGFKIMISADWPKGVVAYLVIGVSVFGVFTILFLRPYADIQSYEWVKKFSRWYFILLLPLLALFFAALWIRVADYGFTLNRYILLITGVWLSVISMYYSLGKNNLKLIPASLALFCLFSFWGPWGMNAVCSKSQKERLNVLLQKNKVDLKSLKETRVIASGNESVSDGQTISTKYVLSASDYKELSSIMRYLLDYHGWESFEDLLSPELIAEMEKNNENKAIGNGLKTDKILRSLSIGKLDAEPKGRILVLSEQSGLELDGFKRISPFSALSDETVEVKLEDYKLEIKLFNAGLQVQKDDMIREVIGNTALQKMLNHAQDATVPLEHMQFDFTMDGRNFRLIASNLNVDYDQRKAKITFASGYILIGK